MHIVSFCYFELHIF